MIARRFRSVLPVLALLALAGAASATDVPYLTGRVTDNAEILSAETRKELTALLAAHEHATTNQVAVLTVATLQGASIEEYTLDVFNAWKLGQRGKDNGVLLVIAPQERRLRIEVGYGLEGTLTDLAASRIIRNVITPRFKQGDYDGGVREGVRVLLAQLRGEAVSIDAAPARATPAKTSDNFFDGPDLNLPERILFGAFIFGIIGLFTAIALVTPGVGWFLYFFLIPFWAMFPIVVLGVTGALYLFGTYLVGFPIAKTLLARSDWYRKAKNDLKTKGHASLGGFTIGGGAGGSSWSSSGSGGGGFSGGGGSSGGGGASGSW